MARKRGNGGQQGKRQGSKKKSHKGLKYTLTTLAVIIGAGVGYGSYEWHALQPKNHFRNLTVIGATNTTNNTTNNTTVQNLPKEATGVFNVLILGSDARKNWTDSHSDSIILIHVNLNTHQYNIMSIPRDTRVYMPGYGYTKLTSVQYMNEVNHGVQQGIIDTVANISQYTGVPINYYAETDYWGLQALVDDLGGITMNVPFPVTMTHPWYPQDKGKVYPKGKDFLDGQDVTEIVHERDSVPGGDYGRQQLQEEALIGIAKAALKPSNFTKLPSLFKDEKKFLLATNMTPTDMISMALAIKGNFDPTTQVHYRQIQGTPETLMDDLLGEKDDQIVIDPNVLKSTVEQYFTK